MFDLLRYKDNTAVITDRGNVLTYNQLSLEVDKFAATIPTKGIVFTLCENALGSFVGYIACMNKAIPQVLLDGSKDLELVQRLISLYHPEYIWMPSSRVGEIGGETLYNYQDYSLQHMSYDEYILSGIHPDLLLCLTTSGSTGSPKLVRLSKKNLESNAYSIAEYLNITSDERPVTSLPMYYSFGMSVINSHLIKGATILLTDKAVMQREFWSFIKEQKATSIAGVPYTYEMLKRLRFFHMDLPYLKTMIQAGGKLNADFVKEYVEYAEMQNKSFIVMYGQTEASPRMSYLPFDKAIEKNASVGIAIPGGQFSLMDDDGREISLPNVDGELIYKGDNVCLGYAETRSDLTKGDENNGILHTGDIAKFDADGFFYITGRLKRFVKIWGNRTNLDAIEQLLKPITTNCACCGVDDLITVFVTEDGIEDQVKALLVEKTGFNPRAFNVILIDTIPMKSSGKIDYPALQKML